MRFAAILCTTALRVKARQCIAVEGAALKMSPESPQSKTTTRGSSASSNNGVIKNLLS
jgi:hypothetical protein